METQPACRHNLPIWCRLPHRVVTAICLPSHGRGNSVTDRIRIFWFSLHWEVFLSIWQHPSHHTPISSCIFTCLWLVKASVELASDWLTSRPSHPDINTSDARGAVYSRIWISHIRSPHTNKKSVRQISTPPMCAHELDFRDHFSSRAWDVVCWCGEQNCWIKCDLAQRSLLTVPANLGYRAWAGDIRLKSGNSHENKDMKIW